MTLPVTIPFPSQPAESSVKIYIDPRGRTFRPVEIIAEWSGTVSVRCVRQTSTGRDYANGQSVSLESATWDDDAAHEIARYARAVVDASTCPVDGSCEVVMVLDRSRMVHYVALPANVSRAILKGVVNHYRGEHSGIFELASVIVDHAELCGQSVALSFYHTLNAFSDSTELQKVAQSLRLSVPEPKSTCSECGESIVPVIPRGRENDITRPTWSHEKDHSELCPVMSE